MSAKIGIQSILQDDDCCSKIFTFLPKEDIIRFGWFVSKDCALNISGETWRTTTCKYKWKNANGYNIMERFESEFQNDLEEIINYGKDTSEHITIADELFVNYEANTKSSNYY